MRKHGTLYLGKKAWARFQAALANPPKANEALKALVRRGEALLKKD